MKTREEIKTMCTNYLQLMLDCANDEAVRDEFRDQPGKILNERNIMYFPEKVHVKLDTKKRRWPVVYIKTKDEKIIIAENRLAVDVIESFPTDKHVAESYKNHEHIKMKSLSELDYDVHAALKNSDIVAVVPYLDIYDDVLTDIKFEDDGEVLLTAC